jgi:sterol desaturase/sphingolipid hydroxylase (fatty acid hydroxylase superfamily)
VPLRELDFVDAALAIAALNALRYALLAGIAALLIALVARRRWPARKIVPQPAADDDVRREVLCSLRTVLIFGLVGACVLWAARRGHTRLYFDVGERGTAWFLASIAVTVVLHDAYFYWTHRAMHTRWLYRAVHRTHHRSTNPTAWAAYSFGPWEALVQAGIFPLVAFTIPIHPLAFATFMLFQVAENVLGHCGWEVFPRWLLRTPLGALTNTPTHHVQHHQRVNANFGLYFNWWDRWLGTNHADYRREFERVTGAPTTAPAATSASSS